MTRNKQTKKQKHCLQGLALGNGRCHFRLEILVSVGANAFSFAKMQSESVPRLGTTAFACPCLYESWVRLEASRRDDSGRRCLLQSLHDERHEDCKDLGSFRSF